MNERLGFMRSIIDAPDDDLPRLAFADWLQDRGEDERAEFIRVQIGIENIDRMRVMRKQVRGGAERQRRILSLREAELLTPNYGLRWAVKELAPTGWFESGAKVGWWGWCRGFAEELRCPSVEFFKFVDDLYWRKTFPCTNRSCVKGTCNDMDIGDICYNEWTCEVCGGKGFLPRECPETAQPIRKVTLAGCPQLIFTGDGHFTWEGYPCRVPLPGQQHHAMDGAGLERCLAATFPGIQFKVTA